MTEFLLAMTVPDGTLWLVLVAAVTSIWGTVKATGVYWTRKEADRTKRYKTVLDAKDKLLKDMLADKDTIISKKDSEIKGLGKDLSRKSDQHAAKVEQLMTLTIVKVEELGEKHLAWGEKAVAAMTVFSAAVDKLNLEEGA